MWPNVFLLAALFLQASGKFTDGIVAGSSSNIQSYPFVVSLHRTNALHTYLCGGTLLNKGWILTSAQCLLMPSSCKVPASALFVLLGKHNLTYLKKWADVHEVFSTFPHESYMNTSHRHNIGLVHLKKPAKVVKIPITKLPENMFKDEAPFEADMDCKFLGWGQLGGSRTQVLVEGPVTLVNQSCGGFENVTDMEICMLRDDTNTKLCGGDLGGALICDEYQVGVVTKGFDCDNETTHSVSIRVDKYLDWIQSTIRNEVAPKVTEMYAVVVVFLINIWL